MKWLLILALILTACGEKHERIKYPVAHFFSCNDSARVCDRLFYARLESWYGPTTFDVMTCIYEPETCASREIVEKMWRGY